MRSPAVAVPVPDGERARRWLFERGLLRRDLRIDRTADQVLIPVLETTTVPGIPSSSVERDFAPARSPKPRRFRDLLPWSEEDLNRLPRAFDVVGDVVLIRLPPELAGRASEVGAALLQFVPGARVVGWDRGVHGPERIRSLSRIAGEGPFRTVHRENGLELEVDLEKAYFSPRLAREHARVAAAVRPGEVLLDLCCGVGPFTLLVARQTQAARVYALDLNPDAIALLLRNRERLNSRVPVVAQVGDLAEFLPTVEPAHRAILNLPLEGIKYLTSVAGAVAPGGTLHFYDVSPHGGEAERLDQLLRPVEAGAGRWTTLLAHRVHPYAPGLDLVAYDFQRSKE